MKYLVLNLEKMVVHSQSGIARNTAHIHERRTMSLSELMLITEGEMYIRHMEDYHLVKNDIFFLPQGIEHYGTKPTDCQLHWHHIFLPSNSYIVDEKDLKNESTGKDTVVLPMHFNLKDPETVFLLSYQLEQYPWTTEETQKVRNALVTAVIGEIALEYRQQSPSIPHKRLNSIISYIDNNFQHHPVSIKVLAETFGYNEKYIHSLFKKYLNVSPLQYIIAQKLKEARQMVLNSSDTVESIAISLHYDNPQYFMRQFKKQFGMTPTEMRRHYSNSLELHLSTERTDE